MGEHRVGLVADTEEVGRFVGLLKRAAGLQLTACAGFPRDIAPEEATWYDDYRVMIAQGGLDLLVLATSPRTAVTVGHIAVEHGVNVWRRPPLGRNFAEAVEVARRLKTSHSGYRISSWWEFAEKPVRLLHKAAFAESAPLLSEVRIGAAGPESASWRSVSTTAGGGVMSQDAYFALEALCALRGLPMGVFGWIGKCRERATGVLRETEDMGTAVLRYSDDGVAMVRAGWDIPPFGETTRHIGSHSELDYDTSGVARLDTSGNEVERLELPREHAELEMQRVVTWIDKPENAERSHRAIERHLMVSAVLEAMYLSARTGQPEDPRRLFEVQKWPAPD